MQQSTITAITNQKGGVLKTTTAENIGIGIAREGKRVLLVDLDPQASLTVALGYQRPDELPVTLPDIMMKILTDKEIRKCNEQGDGAERIPADRKKRI